MSLAAINSATTCFPTFSGILVRQDFQISLFSFHCCLRCTYGCLRTDNSCRSKPVAAVTLLEWKPGDTKGTVARVFSTVASVSRPNVSTIPTARGCRYACGNAYIYFFSTFHIYPNTCIVTVNVTSIMSGCAILKNNIYAVAFNKSCVAACCTATPAERCLALSSNGSYS